MRRLTLITFGFIAMGMGTSLGQESAFPPASPEDPLEAIIVELERHDLVAIAIAGYEEEHQIIHSLLSKPKFISLVDDFVVEFASSRYQDTIDAFTSGAQVPYEELRRVWQDTTQPHHVSDPPVFESFFRAVREANSSLPPQQRLRIVAAEPPIEWSMIDDYEDLLPWLQRRFPYEAEVVEREVLEKGRKALLLSGALHFGNSSPLLNTIDAHGASIFRVWMMPGEKLISLQPDVMSWPRPSLARVAGTILGAADIVESYEALNFPPGAFEEQYDAVIYLGPEAGLTEAQISPQLCADKGYLEMRLRRLRIAADGGAPFLDQFVEYCGRFLEGARSEILR